MKKQLINNEPWKDLDKMYEWLIEETFFTEDELQLVTDINGYSLDTLNDACKCRYALDLEQMWDEYSEEE